MRSEYKGVQIDKPRSDQVSSRLRQASAEQQRRDTKQQLHEKKKDRLVAEHLKISMTRQLYTVVFILAIGLSFAHLALVASGLSAMLGKYLVLVKWPTLPLALLWRPADALWHLGPFGLDKASLVSLLLYGVAFRMVAVAHEMVTEERTEVF